MNPDWERMLLICLGCCACMSVLSSALVLWVAS